MRKTFEDSDFAPDLAQAVGLVVLEAGQVDDKLAELLLICGQERDWWKSGGQLVEALIALGDPEIQPLIDEYSRLYEKRNEVIHASWAHGELGTLQSLRLKTLRRHDAPQGAAINFGPDPLPRLFELAAELRKLSRMANDAGSDYMGIRRSTASGLPQRSTLPPTPSRD
ncbi:hypothetical protein ACQREA_16215 [Dietzia cinnamea]|uniref:hypothetical protein n=1 Tax=Dietzia cinnamea TaxID=321318 RepID=UPI003D05909D